jgi:adenylate cyclase
VLQDVFALQDKVALSVGGIIQPAIETAEIQRAARRPTDNMGSYDLYLRAVQLFRQFAKPQMLEAIDLLDRAIALDPDFAIAIALAATCHGQIILNGWTDDPAPHELRVRQLTTRALAGGRDDAVVFAQVASAYTSGLDDHFSQAIALIDRAISLNPGSSFVWMISGFLRVRSGEPEVAIEHSETAMRLDPVSLFGISAHRVKAFALFEQARFSEAAELIAQTPESWRGGQSAVIAAIYGHLGMWSEASAALKDYAATSFRPVQDWGMDWFRRQEDQQLFLDGIALAERAAPNGPISGA